LLVELNAKALSLTALGALTAVAARFLSAQSLATVGLAVLWIAIYLAGTLIGRLALGTLTILIGLAAGLGLAIG
jgi:hypothetical protein